MEKSEPVKEIRVDDKDVGKTLGTMTGEEENAVEPGGWQGTDDATSTAPSDVPPDFPLPSQSHFYGKDLEAEDPTGYAYGGGIAPEEGGVSDLKGRPVEEARNWEKDPIILDESDSEELEPEEGDESAAA